MFAKKENKNFLEAYLADPSKYMIADRAAGLQFLVSFFNVLRREGNTSPQQNMEELIGVMEQSPALLNTVQLAILLQVNATDLDTAITESGIPLARGFWQEFFARCRHKLIPALIPENDFLYVINSVFYRKTDCFWIADIKRETWIRFFDLLEIKNPEQQALLPAQLFKSLKLLSFQVTQLGLEKEITRYLPQAVQDNNPFVQLNYEVHDLEELLMQHEDNTLVAEQAIQVKKVIALCEENLATVHQYQSDKGTSINQTYITVMLTHRLERMKLLLDTLDRDHSFDTGRLVDLFRGLVRNENRKNSIRELLSQGMGYLAYRIAEHKGNKGDKYITSTPAEYRHMIGSSMWGGFIICFIVIFKNLLTTLHWAPFWQGFAYSINYSAGFLIIEQTHTALATKQPAFTASAIASTLDLRKQDSRPDLQELAITVAKVSRSQFASFFGNLVIVFPVTFIMAWLYDLITGTKIAEGDAAMKLLNDQHFYNSPALLYACFTGVFLFISGLISGYIQNKMYYGQIKERLIKHPLLRVLMAGNRLQSFARFIEKNLGAIIGNIALGFFLGMAGVIVKIFAIPFDIRHITIAAGNVAIGLYGLWGQHLDTSFLVWVFLGVFGIGFFNFLISFSLAFMMAVRSRGIQLREYPEFLGILARYYIKKPLHFIFPPKLNEAVK